MRLDYADIFERRGSPYDRAMRRAPEARRAEFEQLFARFPLSGSESVLDVPAGGGYLRRVLPAGCRVTELELTAGFGAQTPVVGVEADWPVGRFDRVVCLAALHHVADRPAFIAKLVSHTNRGGVAHLADVDVGSPLAEFLDGFVGRFNGMGHEGAYLTREVVASIPGARLASFETRECAWRFADEGELCEFCTDLFGLSDCPQDLLLQALERHVGVGRRDGAVELAWRLAYADLVAEA